MKNKKENNKDWIDKFYEKYFDETTSEEELKKCFQFKNQQIPNSLYQFTKSKHVEDLLVNDLMYLRTFDQLNDPFDGHFLGENKVMTKTSVEELQNEIQIKVEKHRIEVEMDYKKYYKVACFTQDNDDTVMWGVYGDNQKGICMEYDFHKDPVFEFFCMPVNYVEQPNHDRIINKTIDKEHYSNRSADEVFLKKTDNWSHEKEWRIVVNTITPYKHYEFEGDYKYLKFMKPESVYLGIKMEDKEKDRIIEMCKTRNIKVYEMKQDNEKVKLVSDKII